jgi:hypothetical protein
VAVVGDIVVNLAANTQRFAADLNKGQSLLSGFASTAVKALGAVGIGFGLAAAVQSIITNTEEAFQSERRLASAIAATGNAARRSVGQIQELADARMKVTDFGDDATINAAAILTSFKTIQTEAFDRTLLAAQDMAAFFGTDLDSSIRTLGKILSNPEKGMMMLRKAGVHLTDQQKEQIRVFTRSNEIFKAQEVILRELEGRYQGTAENVSSSWKRLWSEIGEGAEETGRILAPIFSNLLVKPFTFLLRTARETGSFIANDFAGDIKSLFSEVGGGAQQFAKAATGATDFSRAMDDVADSAAQVKLVLKDTPLPDDGINAWATETQRLRDELGLLKGEFTEAEFAGKKFFRENFGKMPHGDLERRRKEIVRLNEELLQKQNMGKGGQEFVDQMLRDMEKARNTPKAMDLRSETPAQGTPSLMKGTSQSESAIQAAIRASDKTPMVKVAANTAEANKLLAAGNTNTARLANAVEKLEVIGR